MTNGAIVYRGPSKLTGAPIVVVVTGLRLPSGNSKTGPMAQAWVLNADQAPTEAVASGRDDAICGDCRHRSGSNVGRSCYVVWWLGPQRVFKSLDAYPVTTPQAIAPLLADKNVRFGAFGDPAAAPPHVWFELARAAKGWTGYTHHWRRCDQALRSVLMASVDSEAEKAEARALGWRTFRVRPEGGAVLTDEAICPASEGGEYSTTCDKCRLCSGLHRNARSVVIVAHGQRTKWLEEKSSDGRRFPLAIAR